MGLFRSLPQRCGSSPSPSPTTSTTTILFLLITTFTSTVFAQQQQTSLIPSSGSDSFPACAVQCTLLNQAQDSCLATPGGDRATYVSCFCQSAILTTLHSSPNGVCDAECTNQDDLKTLQSWYSSFCESGGEQPGNGNDNDGDGDNDPPTTTSSSSPTGGSQGSSSNNTEHPSWIESHWQWIVMVVVLIVGFTALAVGGVMLKRRYHRKHDPIPTGPGFLPPPTNRSSSAMQQNHTWGPQQQTLHPRGAEFVGSNPANNSESNLPHRSWTSTPDVTSMTGRMTPNRGRNMI